MDTWTCTDEGLVVDEEAALTKQEKLRNLVEKKRKCDVIAQKIVEHCVLSDDGTEVPVLTKEYMIEKATQITVNHLNDIIVERRISGTCGWTLCSNKIATMPKQQYKIRGNKVLDITERKNFCSSQCYTTFLHYKSQIPNSPLWLRDEEPTPEITILEPTEIEPKTTIHGLTLKFADLD